MKSVLFLSICLILAIPCQAETIIVDANGSGDYLTIQAAINDANNGDIIIVEPNTYTGPGNRDIDFLGKAITVRSTDPNDPNVVAATIIDCNGMKEQLHRGFHFHSGEDANSVLEGLTITNGVAEYDGGGIYCDASSPTITNCTIRGNMVESSGGGGGIMCGAGSNPTVNYCTISENGAFAGGGLACVDSSPLITNCKFSGNDSVLGGGIYSGGCNLKVANCVFTGNIAGGHRPRGGAIFMDPGSLILTNCTIADNCAHDIGAHSGIYSYDGSSLIITNCILYGALQAPEIDVFEGSTTVSYSNVEGTWPGVGNIDADPCFVQLGYYLQGYKWVDGDYHLQSSAGRWDPNSQSWVTDMNTSPCIDAGDPNFDWSQEPQPNGSRINMGAFGGTSQASKTPCYTGPDYDEWVLVGAPVSWCCDTQCHADADCAMETIGRSQFAVGFDDIGILLEGLLESYSGDPSVDTWIAADFDHHAETVGRTSFRVGFNDIDILLTWFVEVHVPTDCQTDSPVSP